MVTPEGLKADGPPHLALRAHSAQVGVRRKLTFDKYDMKS